MPATTSERAPIILPDALAPLVCARRWVVWKWIKTDKGRLTKPPFIAADPRVKASCDDAATWGDFDTAQACYKAGRADGIGFALLGSGLAAFDLDDCRDPESGALQDWAQTLATRCGSYAEITPSRCGVRIIGTANGTKLHRKFIGTAMHAIYGAPNGASLEVYRDAERFICITGMELAPAVAQLAGLDQIAEAVVAELDEAKAVGGQSKMVFDVVGKPAARPSLDEIIKHGHHELWGGDRSKGTWYVINQLIEQGRSDDNIVAVLTSPDNGISAHVLSKPEDPKKYVRRQVLKARKAKREAAASTAGRAGSAAAEGGSVDVFGVEIARLAAFSDLEYERVRKAAAERLEIRATVLDRLVTAERERMRGGPADKLAGRAISFPEPQPWPQPVDGAKLLDDVARTIRSHVLMSEHEGDVCALWILHTYLIDCFQVSPRLSIRSPVKQCGKTTLIDLLNCLVARPLSTANVSPAVVFRVVESYRPTLLIDEVDTFLHGNEELRGILNSGHRKGGTVLRVEGDGHEVRAFSTYGACAFSGIGELPETLGDRSINVELKRKRATDKIEPFRLDRTNHLEPLARQAARWAEDNKIAIAATDPAMPDTLSNRRADNWRILFTLATAAGGNWLELCRQAAAAIAMAGSDDQGARLEMLLEDIQTIFSHQSPDTTEISSAVLVQELIEREERPWSEMDKDKKTLTQNKLARLLRPLGIIPKEIGEKEARKRGYHLNDFREAFERYTTPKPDTSGNATVQPSTNVENTAEFPLPQPSTAKDGWTIGQTESLNKNKGGGRLDGCKPPLTADGGIGPWEWPGLSPRAVAQLAREVAGLRITGAARIEAEIKTRLASSGVPAEVQDIEVEKVVRQIEARQ